MGKTIIILFNTCIDGAFTPSCTGCTLRRLSKDLRATDKVVDTSPVSSVSKYFKLVYINILYHLNSWFPGIEKN